MAAALIVTIVCFAAFLQSLSGFGLAAIIMPLLTIVLGLQTAAPLVALVGLTAYAINLVRFYRAINLGEVLRMGLASAIGVPVGIWVLSNVNESLIKQVLGLLLAAYAIYALARPAASHLLSRFWVYPAGFFAGCLGGAYNTPGPPVIVYGSLRQWPRDEFRASLQTFFFGNAALVVGAHFWANHMTVQVLTLYLYAVPALACGILVSSRVDNKLNRQHFRTIVKVMILALGLLLVLGAGR